MATITDNDLKMFQECARKELTGRGTGSIAWDSVIWDLCHEVRRLRSAVKERGDCAKLREALKLYDRLIQDRTLICDCDIVYGARTLARAALSAPPRNCDRFNNAYEAIEAVDTHCEYAENGCVGCPGVGSYDRDDDCRIAWLFAPATEEKGDNNGNK